MEKLLGDDNVALCLHRVHDGFRRKTERLPEMSIAGTKLDALIDLLLSTRPFEQRWLTVTFDDGYKDALEYVRFAAQRYPFVEFIYFVCPERTEQRLAYVWDEEEQLELARPSERVADSEPFLLATLDECRALLDFPNVKLGNHTNGHLRQRSLRLPESEWELTKSLNDFERMFGKTEHLAFPYGTPELDFDATHVSYLRDVSDAVFWSTEPRPYSSKEREAGAVLPRFAINGTWSLGEILMWIATRAYVHKLKGSPVLYPVSHALPVTLIEKPA